VARPPDGDPATGQAPSRRTARVGGFSDVDGPEAPDDYAALLDAARAQPAVQEWKERTFAALEPVPGAVLLDVGCGTGEDVRALARRVYPFGGLLFDLQ
jgi:2-polyprenyl-3-methyl-5-hydroxy-6-metoxy-1,4-benzoquinol methylase